MSENDPVSDEFRSWVREGLERKAQWMLVYYDFADHLDFAVYCDDDAAVERERAEDEREASNGCQVRLVGAHELRGTEQEIIRRIQREWAAA